MRRALLPYAGSRCVTSFRRYFLSTGSSFLSGGLFRVKTVALPPGKAFEFRTESATPSRLARATITSLHLANYASGQVRDDALLICHGIWFDYESPSFFAFRTPQWFEHLYKAFSRAGKVVSVDANSINVIRSLWPEVATRMTYLPNWVDTNLFYPPERRESDAVTIIFPRRSIICSALICLTDWSAFADARSVDCEETEDTNTEKLWRDETRA